MEDVRCEIQDERLTSPHQLISPSSSSFRVTHHASPCSFLLLILLISTMFTKLEAQVSGCTDPLANNYNSSATANNGSCTYDKASFSPSKFFHLTEEVKETSGLIFYKDALWTQNDSGNEPIIYKIDTANGDILKEVYVSNFQNTDWEEIDQDENYIYIGDFGNNYGSRKDLKILRVLKADIGEQYYDTVTAEALNFNYSDQTSFVSLPHAHNFDCEAMIIKDDSIFLFTKNWQNKKTKLYRLPKSTGYYSAELLDSLNVSGLVTGAAYGAGNEMIILSGYSSYIPMLYLLFDYKNGDFFSGNKRRIDLPGILGSQTEGICFIDKDNVYLSTEDNKIFSQRVFSIPVTEWLYSPPTYIYHVYYNEEISISPNPANSKVSIEVVGKHVEEPIVEVFDQMGNSCDIYFSVFTPTKKGCLVSINVDHLNAGFYIIKVTIANRIKVAKLIIN